MPTCVICLEVLKNPAALPCGHVFCFECIVKLVRTVQPYVHNHFCPTCRQQYTITLANPTFVPPHLRLHVTSSIRRLCLDYSIPKPKQTSAFAKDAAEEPLAAECARLRAENASLKVCCDVWSKRARLHAGTTLGLIGLVRLSKDSAVRTSVEKEELEKKYQSLKRNIEEIEGKVSQSCGSAFCSHPHMAGRHSPVASPSSFCPPSLPSSDEVYSDVESEDEDCEECKRTVKRRRSESVESIAAHTA